MDYFINIAYLCPKIYTFDFQVDNPKHNEPMLQVARSNGRKQYVVKINSLLDLKAFTKIPALVQYRGPH